MHDARWETVLKSVRNQRRENAIIQVAVNNFVKRWMYTVHTVAHKGSDLPRGSQIITMSHIIVLLVQGHLVGLGFVVLLQYNHYVPF